MWTHHRYEMRDKLGAGGMGAVYTARDRLTGEIVALKRVLRTPETALEPRTETEFLTAIAAEFRILAGLRHPHIVRVIDYGFTSEEGKSQPYFTMEYLPSARTICNAAVDAPVDTQVRLLSEMLLALAYLHRRGVIHRDLKPDNVLVDSNGCVKVLDFGLALSAPDKSNSELTETTAGTIAYMAPELFGDQPASVYSDLYAAGMIACEMFTGKYPFNSTNIMVMLNEIMQRPPDVSALDISLGYLLTQLLAKDPTLRPGDALEVIRELCDATGQPVPAESTAVRESFLQASRFVGRIAEFDRLRTALSTILESGSKQAQAYLIGGESGVGKSRLLDELRIHALVKGALVLRGQAVAEGGLPYQLWRDAARELALSTTITDFEAGILREIVPDMSSLLNRDIADAPELTGGVGQQRLVLLLVDILRRQTQPVVLLLEDLHWAVESLVPIRQILSMPEQLPHLLILGTYRDDEFPNLPTELPGMEHVKLHRLDDAAISDLAQSMLGTAGTRSEVLDLLKRETEGNAFFMVETVRALAEESGALSAIGRSTLPRQVFAGGVQQIVRRRLSRVPEYARPLLDRAAVAGRVLDLKVIAALNPNPRPAGANLEAFLTDCTNAGVLETVDGRWRFSHDKLRETILHHLKPEERRDLHRAAAVALEAVYPDDASYHETLMEHWHLAGDEARELHYLVLVARYLIKISADYDRAAQLAEHGLTLVGAADNVTLLNLLSQAAHRRADYPAAVRRAQQARQAAEQHADRPGMAESLTNLGNAAIRQGDTAAGAYFEQSLAIRRSISDRQGIASSLNNLGVVALNRGDYTAAIAYFEQSLVIRREIDHRQDIATSLNNLGIAAVHQGDFSAGRDYYEQSLAIRREIGDRQGTGDSLNNLGTVASFQGDFSAAQEYYEQSLVIRRSTGDQHGVAISLSNMGMAAAHQDNYANARDYFEQSLAISRAIGDLWNITSTQNNLGFVMLAQGDLTPAAAQFHEALALGDTINSTGLILETLVGLARVEVRAGTRPNAAEIAGLVKQHPALDAELRSGQFATLKSELEAALPADELAVAMERGQAFDLETVVQKLLANATT